MDHQDLQSADPTEGLNPFTRHFSLTHLFHAEDVTLLAELGSLAVEGESALREVQHLLPVHPAETTKTMFLLQTPHSVPSMADYPFHSQSIPNSNDSPIERLLIQMILIKQFLIQIIL